MSRSRTHLIAGGISPFFLSFLFAITYGTAPPLLMDNSTIVTVLAAVVISGVIGGKFPDFIEPAVNPRHQGFWHWILGPMVVGFLLYEMYFRQELLLGLVAGLFGFAFVAFLAGYASHVILDLIQKLR
jgi:hypothetical protein